MLEALAYMREQSPSPILFANHAARSAPGLGVYGQDTPAELRNWRAAGQRRRRRGSVRARCTPGPGAGYPPAVVGSDRTPPQRSGSSCS
jgi:hypothetical protein